MKGGLLNRLVISPLIGLTLFFTGCYFVLGGPSTASFATTATNALGFGAGVTLGSLPNLFDSMKDGQAAAGKSGGGGGGGTQAQQEQRQRSAERNTQPERESRNATGNRSNDGTD